MKNRLINNLELKDFTQEKGLVAFYYSAFDNVDLGNDIVRPSAFKKTVSENKNHIYHNRDHREAVGTPVEFGQDDKGAFVVSQLAIKTRDGLDTFEQYKAGIIKGHSMEYNAVKWSYDEQSDIRTITEAKLWGVTSVTNIPMNLNTPTISMKSFEEVSDMMLGIERYLRHGNISEESGKKFLEKYNQLKSLAISLEQKFAADCITAGEAKPIEAIDYNYLTQILKQ